MHLTQDNKQVDCKNETAMISQSKPILSIEHLEISTEKNKLVSDLNFKLYAGQSVALVGESGSGKSLTSLAILGLLADNLNVNGLIKYQGQDLLGLKSKQLESIRGHKIAMIFQEPMTALNPLHRVEKIITEPLLLKGLTRQQARQKAIDLLNDVGLSEIKSKLRSYPHQLSGGQRQRVMIAAALALEPEILIADEPTTALDVTLQMQVLELLKHQIQKRNMSMILISHDLNLVKQYTDYVVVMKQGEVIEQADVKTLFSQPKSNYTKTLLSHDFGPCAASEASDQTLLSLNHLSVNFKLSSSWFKRGDRYFTAVEQFNLSMFSGQSIGIVGGSGSGKSSLALAISRLIASEGEIVFLGQDLNQLNQKKLRPIRSNIQIVFQDPFSSLNPRRNIEQIIGEGLTLKSFSASEKTEKIEEVLIKVGLNSLDKTKYPHEFSGGQRQRIALARALILKPKLIILDEPTSALDRATQRSIVKLLRDLQESEGLSYLFISHDLKVIRALCHRVIVLKEGKILEQQDTDALFKHPQHSYTQRLISASEYRID